MNTKMPLKPMISVHFPEQKLELVNAVIPDHLHGEVSSDFLALLHFSESVKQAFIQYLHHLESRIGNKSMDTVREEFEARLPRQM
jgi:hypothetical protein